jgi:hypothetical protein
MISAENLAVGPVVPVISTNRAPFARSPLSTTDSILNHEETPWLLRSRIGGAPGRPDDGKALVPVKAYRGARTSCAQE